MAVVSIKREAPPDITRDLKTDNAKHLTIAGFYRHGELLRYREGIRAELEARPDWDVIEVFPNVKLVNIPDDSHLSGDSALLFALGHLYKDVFKKWGQDFESTENVVNYFRNLYEFHANGQNVARSIAVLLIDDMPIGGFVNLLGTRKDLIDHIMQTLRQNYAIPEEDIITDIAITSRESRLKEISEKIRNISNDKTIGYPAELFMMDRLSVEFLIHCNLNNILAGLSQDNLEGYPGSLVNLIKSFKLYATDEGLFNPKNGDTLERGIYRLMTLILVSRGFDNLVKHGVDYLVQWTVTTEDPTQEDSSSFNLARILRGVKAKQGHPFVQFLSVFQELLDRDKLKALVNFIKETQILWEDQIVEGKFRELLQGAPNSTRVLVTGMPIGILKFVSDFYLFQFAFKGKINLRILKQMLEK